MKVTKTQAPNTNKEACRRPTDFKWFCGVADQLEGEGTRTRDFVAATSSQSRWSGCFRGSEESVRQLLLLSSPPRSLSCCCCFLTVTVLPPLASLIPEMSTSDDEEEEEAREETEESRLRSCCCFAVEGFERTDTGVGGGAAATHFLVVDEEVRACRRRFTRSPNGSMN